VLEQFPYYWFCSNTSVWKSPRREDNLTWCQRLERVNVTSCQVERFLYWNQQLDAVDVFQKANYFTKTQTLSKTAANREHVLTERSTICFSF